MVLCYDESLLVQPNKRYSERAKSVHSALCGGRTISLRVCARDASHSTIAWRPHTARTYSFHWESSPRDAQSITLPRIGCCAAPGLLKISNIFSLSPGSFSSAALSVSICCDLYCLFTRSSLSDGRVGERVFAIFSWMLSPHPRKWSPAFKLHWNLFSPWPSYWQTMLRDSQRIFRKRLFFSLSLSVRIEGKLKCVHFPLTPKRKYGSRASVSSARMLERGGDWRERVWVSI